ncbi:MAG: acyl-ACP--UDP-N-acetylglucosamine O-acyltransferase [Chthoniobacterales bacterium]
MSEIHPTAVIDSEVEIGEGTQIGPHCVITGPVRIGKNNTFQSHVVVHGPTEIGEGNYFFPFNSIGQRSQDLKYKEEPTHLKIGDRNSFREFCTVNRGTAPNSCTHIGNDNNFLAYSHVAHDCTVGNHIIFSNNGTIGGHVEVEDYAIIGGLSGVHQFCRIGRHAIIGGCTKIVQDVPPYMIADGQPAEIRGTNKIGLERHGFTPEQLKEIREAYRLIWRSNMNVKQACDAIREQLQQTEEVKIFLEFVESSQRGIIR